MQNDHGSLESQPSPESKAAQFHFNLGDPIQIKSGSYKGRKGAVVDRWIDDTFANGSVEMYLIQLPGGDAVQLSDRYLATDRRVKSRR